MNRLVRDLSILGVEILAMSAGAIVGLLVISQLLNSATVERVATVPIIGRILDGMRAAVGQIVTPTAQ